MFDRRHRWGEPVRNGILISRTCRACGITRSVETIIPDAFVNAIVDNLFAPNIYRTIARV